MQRYIISVGSVTYAIKGRDLLRKSGIKAFIERKINKNGSVGCGYVIVAEGSRDRIIGLLTNSGVKIFEINGIKL